MADRDPACEIAEELDAVSAEIRRHAHRLVAGIRSRRRRAITEAELREHMEDAVYHWGLQGIPPTEALRRTLADWGDPARQKQLLADAENTLPPAFFSRLGAWVGRLAVATLVTLLLWAGAEVFGAGFEWFHVLPGVLILCGLWPLRYGRAVARRLCFRSQLKKHCREKGYTLILSPGLLSLLTGYGCAYTVSDGKRVLYMRTLSALCRRESLHVWDETILEWRKTRTGAGLIDRLPGQFNLIRASHNVTVNRRLAA